MADEVLIMAEILLFREKTNMVISEEVIVLEAQCIFIILMAQSIGKQKFLSRISPSDNLKVNKDCLSRDG